jgi:hypothetical protein
MNWISTKDDLPNDGERVIIFTKESNSFINNEPIHIYAANFIRGISEEERIKMKNGELSDHIEYGWCASEGYTAHKRSDVYSFGDEWSNNEVGYAWKDGPYSWNGQEVIYWARPKDPRK